ncbi:SUMF1/EgtB/PvdO family nonheme iron enzyme [Scytonema sp. UIC 10036]|uniref:SUMF1/EgtB/PvdO family nonheme iron enzyme n=1 Tax=Scytonema sp. UIC 10036 TaxID=2304196 RepID=UPI0012DA27BA|nr:SUMF1/EgtB/PvdO family nonheme iron enzyme [Scytonema sp. UIC 10036]MUG94448.1 SUMF1/EgtB/PvdO family nonheme iron enzyme [Scytonema sp. UIC 10036]
MTTTPDELVAILDRILAGIRDEEEITLLRRSLKISGSTLQYVSQDGKFNTNIGQITGGEVHFGDLYQGADAETIKAVFRELLPELVRTIGIEKLPQQNSQIFLPSNLSSQTTDKNVVTTPNSETQLLPSTAKPALATFEFEVVTVDVDGRENKRSRKQAEYFIENLGGGVVLEMVSIPEGKFQMGASQDEEASQEDERPQHIVTVTPFFMGKYPITQMQWRAVSKLPTIQRHLDEEPSGFKGDKLPIEYISGSSVLVMLK